MLKLNSIIIDIQKYNSKQFGSLKNWAADALFKKLIYFFCLKHQLSLKHRTFLIKFLTNTKKIFCYEE